MSEELYDEVQPYVDAAEQEFGVPAEMINSVIHHESRYKPGAKSNKGAIGLMQITKDIARKYKVINPHDPVQNIRAGTAYLAELLEKYQGNQEKALMAYHAGPTNVAEGDIGPKTRKYATRIMDDLRNPGMVESLYRKPAKGSLRDWSKQKAGI